MGEIVHYGVKGMRWGVRRYQNKDGSLTPLGKKRQDKLVEKEVSKNRKLADSWNETVSKSKQKVNNSRSETERSYHQRVIADGERYSKQLLSNAKKLSDINEKGIAMTKKEIKNWAIYGHPFR